MNKPISIAINDTKNSIISSINESGLPACVLLEILNSLVSQINELAKKYELRFIIFKTTEVNYTDGKINGANVETELIY